MLQTILPYETFEVLRMIYVAIEIHCLQCKLHRKLDMQYVESELTRTLVCCTFITRPHLFIARLVIM